MKLSKNQIIYQKKKLKAIKLKECGHICPNCGSTFNLQLSHIVPVGQNKSLELVPENSLIDCHECHEIWENKAKNWNKSFHWIKNFRERFLIIKMLDEGYYNRIIIKMPDHIALVVDYYVQKNYF